MHTDRLGACFCVCYTIDMKKKIYIGADHAGFDLKEKIKDFLKKKRIPYEDMGNTEYDPHDDYPDFGSAVANAVARHKTKGILVCGSSYGVCIVANKRKGIRAVSVNTVKDAQLAREHNDANIVCLSGWHASPLHAKKIVETFLTTETSRIDRHVRRVKKIKKYEGQQMK